ncbi:TRIL protein, partial [Atractosteus spatula]|nr:TRIL protein [Atractosteus spatula]
MAKFIIYLISLFPYKIQASLCPQACNCHDMDIFFSNSGLTYVPQILGTHSPAQYLSLGGNFIRSVGTGDFLFYTQLNRLDLQYNVISSIQPRSFESLKKLKELYLGHNRISFLESQSLYLSRNNVTISSGGVFKHLRSLSDIQLDDNAITRIWNGTFLTLSELKTLSLSNNVITEIDYDQFDGDIRFSRFININKGNVCNLRDLRASTSYFVCVESVVNEKVCEVAPRDLCIGIVTKGENNSTPDPQLVILYISGANAVAITITLVIIICAVGLKTRKRKSPPDSLGMVYSRNRRVCCAVCVGLPSDYNSGYNSNSSHTGTYQPNEIGAIDLPQVD